MTQASFDIAFSAHPVGLVARVQGEGSLENTVAYWQAIVAELSARPAPALLLIDEMHGDALPEQDWQRLVEAMKGTGLDQLRIAHVKPLGLQNVEYCELFALEAGLRARVFSSEDEAITWLRYGLSWMDEPVGGISSQLPVLHADEHLAVIDKPAGLMVHDSKLARGETDFAADRLREQFGKPIFLIHRLDRATSGCLLLAFDRETASVLGKTLMSGDVEKDYLAVCRGWPEEKFSVDHPLDGGPGKPVKKPAVTHFARLATGELPVPSNGFETSRYALLRCQLETGRFRQIRRHLKHSFHHLIGDTSHGDGRHNLQFRMRGVHRMLLHASRLAFVHPVGGQRIEAVAPLDAEFSRAFALFDWDANNPSPKGTSFGA